VGAQQGGGGARVGEGRGRQVHVHAVPSYAMLCHAMPCYAMLCHAMPYRAMLCRCTRWHAMVHHGGKELAPSSEVPRQPPAAHPSRPATCQPLAAAAHCPHSKHPSSLPGPKCCGEPASRGAHGSQCLVATRCQTRLLSRPHVWQAAERRLQTAAGCRHALVQKMLQRLRLHHSN
jgi:hypothetical protein